MTADPDCIFCKIVEGELPSDRIHEDDRTIAFMDINPASDGHSLVIPRSHTVDLHSIDPDDLAAVTVVAQQVARRAVERLGADGVNLLNCAGADAWQTVFHFHMHVVPRYAGKPDKDRLRLPWDTTPGDPAVISAAAAQLRE